MCITASWAASVAVGPNSALSDVPNVRITRPESGRVADISGTSQKCRLCCKSLKTPGDKFPARSRNKPRSLIDVASGSLPKSPVSLSPGDEVPHMFTRKPRLQLEKFVINGAKRLLQHNLPKLAVSNRSNAAPHSITSSARSMNEAGTTRPSDFAVCRLIISSNRVGRRTGRSAGLASLRPDGVASPATRSGETRGPPEGSAPRGPRSTSNTSGLTPAGAASGRCAPG